VAADWEGQEQAEARSLLVLHLLQEVSERGSILVCEAVRHAIRWVGA
jgi:hypothetical protein